MTEPVYLPHELDDAALAEQMGGWRKLTRQGILGAKELTAGYAEELRRRQRGDVVFPRPVEVPAPRVSPEVRIPTEHKMSKPWWRFW